MEGIRGIGEKGRLGPAAYTPTWLVKLVNKVNLGKLSEPIETMELVKLVKRVWHGSSSFGSPNNTAW